MRIIGACLLTAALGLMLFPPWRGTHYIGHRPLWNGRGSPDWSRLALEFCFVAVICALAAVVAPMAGHSPASTLKNWFRRAGLVLGCGSVLILVATAAHDGIVSVSELRDYDRRVEEFRNEAKVLQQAFPLIPADDSDHHISILISNFHEAEIILQHFGYSEQDVQWAKGQFLVKRYEGSVGFALRNPAREVWFGFDRYADQEFFAPLPDWYTEALQHNIEVARVPYWMKPGEPPAPWSFREWLELRSPWLIPAAVLLAVSALCFVTASRVDSTRPTAKNGVGGARV
jgi:hypothetical protein